MDGNGVICPGCDYLLTIPSREDRVSVLDVSKDKYNRVKSKKMDHDLVKHHRSLTEGEHHEWEDTQLESRDGGLKIMIPIALFSLLLIGGLAYLLLAENNDRPKGPTNVTVNTIPFGSDGSEAKVDDEDDAQSVYTYNSKDENQVAQLEEFLTGMFAAKTVDEMLPFVRPVDNIKEKMVNFYKGRSLSQSLFKELKFAQNTPGYPEYLSFSCQSQDYSNHDGILKYTKDEILLDWESFVAYSDMSWEELAEKKPTDSVRVRVTAKRTHYYNEEFTDERKWQAVSLISPNEDEPIYGYVQRGSATSQRLFNFGLSDDRKVVLDVYFPKGAKKGNQVFIDRVVEQGWVVKEKK